MARKPHFHAIVGALFGYPEEPTEPPIEYGQIDTVELHRHVPVMVDVEDIGTTYVARHAPIMVNPGFIGSIKAAKHALINVNQEDKAVPENIRHTIMWDQLRDADWNVQIRSGGGDFDATVNINPGLTSPAAVTDVEYKIGSGSWTSTGLSAYPMSFNLTDAVAQEIRVRVATAAGYSLGDESLFKNANFGTFEDASYFENETTSESVTITADASTTFLVLVGVYKIGTAAEPAVTYGTPARTHGTGTTLDGTGVSFNYNSRVQLCAYIVPAGEASDWSIQLTHGASMQRCVVEVYKIPKGFDTVGNGSIAGGTFTAFPITNNTTVANGPSILVGWGVFFETAELQVWPSQANYPRVRESSYDETVTGLYNQYNHDNSAVTMGFSMPSKNGYRGLLNFELYMGP